MVDDQLARWLARLPLSEQVQIRRHDEQADSFPTSSHPRTDRCRHCGCRLKAEDASDPLTRCALCRSRRRGERKGLRSRAAMKT